VRISDNDKREIKFSQCLTKYHAIKHHARRRLRSGGITPRTLTSALDEVEWSASRLGRFTSLGKASGTHLVGGGVGPRVGLDAVAKRKNPVPVGNRTLAVESVAS